MVGGGRFFFYHVIIEKGCYEGEKYTEKLTESINKQRGTDREKKG